MFHSHLRLWLTRAALDQPVVKTTAAKAVVGAVYSGIVAFLGGLTLALTDGAVTGLEWVTIASTTVPAAINNSGTVVGARLNGSNYEPLVSVGGGAWSSLPVLPGAVSVFPTDIGGGISFGIS